MAISEDTRSSTCIYGNTSICMCVCTYVYVCKRICVCVCNMKFEASADRNFYWLDLLFASVTSPCLNTVFNQLFYDLQRMLQLNYDAALILRCSSKKKKDVALFEMSKMWKVSIFDEIIPSVFYRSYYWLKFYTTNEYLDLDGPPHFPSPHWNPYGSLS